MKAREVRPTGNRQTPASDVVAEHRAGESATSSTESEPRVGESVQQEAAGVSGHRRQEGLLQCFIWKAVSG